MSAHTTSPGSSTRDPGLPCGSAAWAPNRMCGSACLPPRRLRLYCARALTSASVCPGPQVGPDLLVHLLYATAGRPHRLDLLRVLGRPQLHDQVGGRHQLEPRRGERARAGEVEVVLLDADPPGAVEHPPHLGQPVRLAGWIQDALKAGRRHADPLAVERRRDQRARTAAPHRHAEEPLELQAPEAGQVGDRGVLGGEHGVEAGLLEETVERDDAGVGAGGHARHPIRPPRQRQTLTVDLRLRQIA